MSVRAKFKVCRIAKNHPDYGCEVHLSPVYSADPAHENKRFWDATPSGTFQMTIKSSAAAECFELGAEYYVDFTKAGE